MRKAAGVDQVGISADCGQESSSKGTVTGVILHLGQTFGAQVVFPAGLAAGPHVSSLLLAFAAFLALRTTKLSPALLVLAAALLGIASTWFWR
ncbi:MAG: hypothetical protein ABI689_01105 [Thermoanaerobaculia bacterium]